MKSIKLKAEFDAEIGSGQGRLVLFYSSWCPFCTSFLPVFERVAAANAGAFARVSIDDLPELEDAFAIEVVPTVLFFKDGRLSSRLDGVLGLGLNADILGAFVKACVPGWKKP